MLGQDFESTREVADVLDAAREQRRAGLLEVDARLLRVEEGRLIRARRVVVRVPRPPVAARLAARGDVNPHLAVDRSVLADGRWVKVPIRESGVYRIDAAFLRDSLGVEGVSMGSVAVYGTGGRVLPAVNATPRPADLLEVLPHFDESLVHLALDRVDALLVGLDHQALGDRRVLARVTWAKHRWLIAGVVAWAIAWILAWLIAEVIAW